MKTPVILASAVTLIAASAVWYGSSTTPDVVVIEGHERAQPQTYQPAPKPKAKNDLRPREVVTIDIPEEELAELTLDERLQLENDAELAAEEAALAAADEVIDEVQLQQWFPDLTTQEREFLTLALAQEPELREAILTAVAENNGAAFGGQAYQPQQRSKARIEAEIQDSQREITDLEYLMAEAEKAGIDASELQGAQDRIAELQQTIDELMAQQPEELEPPKQIDNLAGSDGEARVKE